MQYVQWHKQRYKDVVKFLRKGKGARPNILDRFDITEKNKALFHDRRQIIPEHVVDRTLRQMMYGKDSECPISRDSMFNYARDRFWGISRRAVMKFLRAQPTYTKLAKRPAKQRAPGSNFFRTHKGLVGVDLVYLGHAAFPPGFLNRSKGDQKLKKNTPHLIMTMVDSLTHYAFAKFIGTSATGTICANAFETLMREYYHVFGYLPKLVMSDSGEEFDSKAFRRMVKRRKLGHNYVKVVAFVEQFNSIVQKYMVMLATGARTSNNIETVLANSVKRANNGTFFRMKRSIRMCVNFLKNSPKEYMKQWTKGQRKDKPKKNRQKWKKGMKVRFWKGGTKDDSMFKRYNGLTEVRGRKGGMPKGQKARSQWSARVYTVTGVMTRGKTYLQLNANPPKIQRLMDRQDLSKEMIAKYKRLKRKIPTNKRKKYIPADLFQRVLDDDQESARLIASRL